MIIVILTIIPLVLGVFFTKARIFRKHDVISGGVGPALIIAFGIFLSLEVVALLVVNYEVEANTAYNHEQYKVLYYEAENHIYDNDNDVGKKELVDQIREWNSKLAYGRVVHNSKWTNWFCPIDYNQFEFIPIEMVN